MSARLEDKTVLPPDEPHRSEFARLAALLPDRRHRDPRQRPARLIGPDGHDVELPDDLYAVLLNVVHSLAKGMGVTIQPSNAELTTQQAADLIGISRPTLVRLLMDGAIPHHMVGRHRRVFLEDLLEYDQRSRHARRKALAELSHEAAHDGTDDETNEIISTR
jgi:excisionase family DNA binding protein